jgi:acyl carrier protein
VNTVDEFLVLLRDDLGLPVTADDLDRPFDEIRGWDSVHVLTLLSLLERRLGRSVPFAEALAAASLGDMYRLAAATPASPR